MKAFYKNSKGLIPCSVWEPNCWVNIECPTESEKVYLVDNLGVPLSFLNDIEDIDERPRIEMENGWCLIVLRIPHKNDDPRLPYITVPIGIIFKDDILVTVCHIKTELINDFILYTVRKSINFTSQFDLVLKLSLSSSVWFLKYLKQINQLIKVAEDKLEKSIKNEDLQTLLQIEKCLVFFTTSLKGNDILIHRIKNLKIDYDQELMEDVDIEIRQAQETTNIYNDILTGMMDAYASVISNNLNVIMKQLTSISIILMIPTLIASLYGMNVPNSFSDNRFGFWIVLFVSFLIATMGVMLFKKKNWF
jgi:magnesium transporter